MANRRDLLKRVGAAGVVVVGGGAAVVVADEAAKAAEPGPRKFALILLDRSGSMHKVRKATVDGLNTFLDEQRGQVDLYIGLIQFDASGVAGLDITPTIEFTTAPQCPKLTLKDYMPRGTTPLLAAVAEAIKRLETVVRAQDRALLVIQTDGYENASPPEITKDVIKDLIAAKTAEGNWTFVFMGADIDAWGEGGSIGVAVGNTQSYANTGVGTYAAYAATSIGTQSWATSNLTATANFYEPPTTTAAGHVIVVPSKPKRSRRNKSS